VNLAVAAHRPSGEVDSAAVEKALSGLAGEIPPLADGEVTVWTARSGRAVLAGVSHRSDATGGVPYAAATPTRAAAFSGRPFLWRDDDGADGRSALVASAFLNPPDRWAPGLDGRCAVFRYDDDSGVLTVFTDHLGSYPVYAGRHNGTLVVSNNAELVRRLAGAGEPRVEALATFLGCGWALGGTPLSSGVERLPRGRLSHWGPDGASHRELLPLDQLAGWFGNGFSARGAGRRLVAATSALADWPGRPAVLPLTGGRDSRLVFAAALKADLDCSAETSALPHLPGYPDTDDVVTARELCESAGRPHQVNDSTEEQFDLVKALRVMRLATPGTFSLGGISPNMVAAFLAPPSDLPMRILLTGASGETARAYYGNGEGLDSAGLAALLCGRMMHRWPRPILSRAGLDVIDRHVNRWVASALGGGVAARDVPDLFYLLERMSNWAGPLHGISEYTRDAVAPLWSRFVVRQELAVPAEGRAEGRFQREVLGELAPRLAEIPYEGAAKGYGRRAEAAKLMRQALAELRRRAGLGIERDGRERDPLIAAHPRIRDAVEGTPSHPAWEVLDRRATRRLLRRDPARLDPRSRDQAWRLATVFLDPLAA
jgi:hypothetical protein